MTEKMTDNVVVFCFSFMCHVCVLSLICLFIISGEFDALHQLSVIKFPFKRKGLPSCSASLHVKAKQYTCASDYPTLPRFFVQTLNMIKHFFKHFIVNLKKTIVK